MSRATRERVLKRHSSNAVLRNRTRGLCCLDLFRIRGAGVRDKRLPDSVFITSVVCKGLHICTLIRAAGFSAVHKLSYRISRALRQTLDNTPLTRLQGYRVSQEVP